jgi:hypothetical protein
MCYNDLVRKIGLSLTICIIVSGLFLVSHFYSRWQNPKWQNNFRLNAAILPASDDSRSLYLTLNPGFRAEFGDRANPTSAFLRFEVIKATSALTKKSADINPNFFNTFQTATALNTYQPGIQWQLFSVGIDEQQVDSAQILGNTPELAAATKHILAPNLIATTSTQINDVLSDKQNITTQYALTRHQGYDQLENLAVAENTDLTYTIIPGVGVEMSIIIGDRQDFNTACFKLLSLTGSTASCHLPVNRFSFLLQLDPEQTLAHTPLTLDGGEQGTDYILDSNGEFLLRLGNWRLSDAAGNTSQALTLTLRPGLVGDTPAPGYYIVTLVADFNWLLSNERVFPVKLQSGFYRDYGEFFSAH